MKLLIPLAYLNEACFLSLNVDEKKYKMVLKLAQESLADILGAEFYAQIETQYAASGDTFSTDNATLYEDYIKDYLAWSTYMNYLGFSQVDSTPTGPRAFKDENSDLADQVQLFSLEKNVMKHVNNYKYRMINFLNNQQSITPTKYPLFKGHCKVEFSWGITSIAGNGQLEQIISVNKAVRDNE